MVKIGGTPTLWCIPNRIPEGTKFSGRFAGTSKSKTKSGDVEVVIFHASIAGEVAEWQIFPRNLHSPVPIVIEEQDFSAIVKGNYLEITCL